MALITPHGATLKDGSGVTVRCPVPDEWAALRDMLLAMAADAPYIVTQPDEFKTDETFWRTRITDWAAAAGNLIVIAERDGAFLGECSLKSPDRRRLAHHCEIGMGMPPAARGLGVGRAVLSAALDWAADHPLIEKVYLGVVPENAPAVALYESLGFRPEGRQVGYIKHADGRRFDCLIMAVYVKPACAPPAAGVYRRRG